MLKKIINVFTLAVMSLTMLAGMLQTAPSVEVGATLTPGRETLCPDGNCPLTGATNVDASRGGIVDIILRAARFLIFIGAAVAVIFMVYGGFLYMTAEASDRSEGGRKTLINATIGLVVSIVAVTIVNFIAGFVQGDLLSAG